MVMARTTLASWLATVAVLLAAALGCTRSAPDVAGQWQLSWHGRIGTEEATVALRPSGQRLTGSFRTARGSAPLSGSLAGPKLSFTVNFPGPPPYRILFTGVAQDNQIGGQAQPQDVTGRAFAGHGGEVSRDYYSWSAVRAVP